MKSIIQLPSANQYYSYQDLLKRMGYLEKTIEKLMSYSSILSLKTTEGIIFIKSSEIIYLKAESNYTYIHLYNGKKLVASKTLKYLHSQMPNNLFVRVHHSFVVNKDQIDRCIPGTNKFLILKSGLELPVSKKYFENILNIFEASF